MTNALVKALFVAMLPAVDEFSTKLGLDTPHPVTAAHVRSFSQVTGTLSLCVLTNGYIFRCNAGSVYEFLGKDLVKIEGGKLAGGKVNVSKAEGIEKVRSCTRKLGNATLSSIASLEPEIDVPWKVAGKLNAYYFLRFYQPNSTQRRVVLEAIVNAETGALEKYYSILNVCRHISPTLEAATREIPKPALPDSEPAQAARQLEIVLPEVAWFASKVGLKLQGPLGTNSVLQFAETRSFRGDYHSLVLTNDVEFLCFKGAVFGFAHSDMFFADSPRGIEGFTGKWRISRDQEVSLVRNAVRALGNRKLIALSRRRPEVHEPRLIGRRDVPRVYLHWEDDAYEIEAEVDADRGRIVGLRFLPPVTW